MGSALDATRPAAIVTSVTVLAAAALVVALAIEINLYRGGTGPTVATSVSVASTSREVNGIQLHLSARFGSVDRIAQVVAFPVGDFTSRTTMEFFNDPAYPYAGGSSALVDAVMSNIAAQVSVEAPEITVGRLDSMGLVSMLRDTASAATKVILILGGSLPIQAFSKSTNLVTPWVDGGGLLVWAGDAIGYYSVSPGDHLDPRASKNLQAAGSEMLLGVPLVSFPTVFGRMGASASPIAAALSLRYSDSSSGLVRSIIDRGGGLDLGFRGDAITSIAFRPHGRGGYLIFGGRVGDPAVVAFDVTRILFSNILASTGDIAAINIHSTDVELTTASLYIDLPRTVHRVMIVATGSDTYPYFLTAIALNVAL